MTKPTADLLDAAALRMAAADLLSRREHSRRELFRKLSPRAESADILNQVLDELTERGWQSDQRFTDSFVRSKSQRSIGPVRLRQELRQKGIADSQVRQGIGESDTDWFAMALEAARRKARGLDLDDQKDKAKLYRFLAYRGYTADQIQYAINECRSSDDDDQ
ncbi:regulatory protein RecX [Oceanobacter mangrovi]|uniref:regulatory protein RecX n=1 Tax=Oceanobacter mangrovi TaxID=2862510 RepID=UPI001C8DC325|nr:regulatory protein RecX [Oceanobacter mangrovi]